MRKQISRLGGVFAASLGVALWLLAGSALAAFAPPAAPVDGYVVDQTNTLSGSEIAELNQQIATYNQSNKAEIGVLMISTLDDTYLEEASLSTARAWGIGQSRKNNGVLIFIAKNDRKIRIEVGTGLEGELTDAQAGRIVRNWIAPEFKKDAYFVGIKRGLEGIAGFLSLASVDVSSLKHSGEGISMFHLMIIIIVASFILRLLFSKKYRRSILSTVARSGGHHRSSGSGRSSSSGRSSGSGGFSGGGRFGGGGASGSW